MGRRDNQSRHEATIDDEERALSRNPAFQTLLQRSRESIAREGAIALEDLDELLALTEEEEAQGQTLWEQFQREEPDMPEDDTGGHSATDAGPAERAGRLGIATRVERSE